MRARAVVAAAALVATAGRWKSVVKMSFGDFGGCGGGGCCGGDGARCCGGESERGGDGERDNVLSASGVGKKRGEEKKVGS